MYFDALTMACVAGELRSTILGGRVQQVLLIDNLSIGLEVYAQHQRHYLLASAHAELGRLLLASEKLRRGLDRQTGLLLLLRKYARGASIAAIEQPPFERVLRLEFEHPEWGSSNLVVEIMGRHSNVILVDALGRVLDAVKHVTPAMSPARPVLPNQAYSPPPPQEKLLPSDLTEYRLRQILEAHEPSDQLWQALVRGLAGMSPLLAREIAFRTLGQPRARLAQVERLTPILEAIHELLAPLQTGDWQPTVALEEGEPVAYAPYQLTHRGELGAMPSISQAIEVYTAAAASADPYAAAKRPVREAIASARGRLEARRAALTRSMEEAAEAERWRQWGEWILAYAHTVEPGQSELVADTGQGQVLHIPLDPQLSAVDNAQAYFARYRKAQRAGEEVPRQLRETELALRDLDQLETDLELASSRPEIEEVRRTLVEAGYLRSKKQRRGMPGSQPFSMTSADGLPILVGRNSRQNDEVTFRRATAGDWWFHARGVPGAHVIVRTEGADLPPRSLRRAAELAAYFSRLRGEPDVLVDYVQRRHVRRIPGAAPGLVTYSQEQTIRVPPRGPDIDEGET
ncbi:MAG TPA: fibronectin/fibrinogen-binding protein [Chloroflexi bacterium]|nr:fibronectin/fibrinogen-binding protein [Chloroflexota bacterium]